MVLSWVDLSLQDSIKPFSLELEKNDFLFLAGETHRDKLLRALAGFLPKESNSQDAIRIDGKSLKKDERLDSVLLPKNAVESFPAHRTIGQFALDIAPNRNIKSLETYAAKHGIEKKLLSCKASEISWPIMQKISLWCTSLLASRAVFIEEPDEGFYEECRPFDFLQGMLTSGITNCIIFSAAEKDSILQKARAMQLCRTRIAIFCADRLVEEGEATRVLENPTHNYTKVWIENGDLRPKINETVWKYCLPNCKKRYCKRQIFSSIMWDCEPNTLHKIMCRGFLE